MLRNYAQFIGRLTRDIEIRTTQSGKSVGNFTVAVNRQYNKEHDHPEADFFSCVVWDKTAEFVCKYFHKGDWIGVSGRLQNRDWENKDGVKMRSTELIVDEVEFIGNKASNEQSSGEAQAPAARKPASAPKQDVSQMDDELPF
jgi:single-strand DNA-binding protein